MSKVHLEFPEICFPCKGHDCFALRYEAEELFWISGVSGWFCKSCIPFYAKEGFRENLMSLSEFSHIKISGKCGINECSQYHDPEELFWITVMNNFVCRSCYLKIQDDCSVV